MRSSKKLQILFLIYDKSPKDKQKFPTKLNTLKLHVTQKFWANTFEIYDIFLAKQVSADHVNDHPRPAILSKRC